MRQLGSRLLAGLDLEHGDAQRHDAARVLEGLDDLGRVVEGQVLA